MNEEIQLQLKERIRNLPQAPGVYRFSDSSNKVIYVGKAKNLKKRVASYFVSRQNDSRKLQVLVKSIQSISYTIVDSELDSLLLENSLIKKLKPKFNILLKDDKTYPWIVVKNERFPRIFATRRIIKDNSKYFGPYGSKNMVNELLGLIEETFPLRNCNYDLSQENIDKKKYKVCLEYQLKKCLGPCEAYQTEDSYNYYIKCIENILKGNIFEVIRNTEEKINNYTKLLQFENAHIEKQKLLKLKNYQSKSTIVNSKLPNLDVFSIKTRNQLSFVNYIKVINGCIVNTMNIEVKKKLEETDAEILSYAITELRNRFADPAKEIICSILPKTVLADLNYTIPKIGDKKKLLELSEKNLSYYIKDAIKNYEKTDPDLKLNNLLSSFQNDLRLKTLPKRIECIDNSNLQGMYAVSAVVVFENLKPSKKDYRIYNVKTVEGINDFDTMKEIISRRFEKPANEINYPDLLIIDGGKGQLSSAFSALKKLNLENKIPVIGIAKRLEEIFYPNDKFPIYIDKRSHSLKVIQQLRNEAHRFGITRHRNKRDKSIIHSELENIKGIGLKSQEKLLQKFKSLKNIINAKDEELKEILNEKQLKELRNYTKERL